MDSNAGGLCWVQAAIASGHKSQSTGRQREPEFVAPITSTSYAAATLVEAGFERRLSYSHSPAILVRCSVEGHDRRTQIGTSRDERRERCHRLPCPRGVTSIPPLPLPSTDDSAESARGLARELHGRTARDARGRGRLSKRSATSTVADITGFACSLIPTPLTSADRECSCRLSATQPCTRSNLASPVCRLSC